METMAVVNLGGGVTGAASRAVRVAPTGNPVKGIGGFDVARDRRRAYKPEWLTAPTRPDSATRTLSV
ncbi:hypothetical protein [Cellulomonas bogoriensis]